MRRIIIIIIFLLTFCISKGQTFYSQMAAQYAAEGDYEKAMENQKDYINFLTNQENTVDSLIIGEAYHYFALYNSAIKHYAEAIEAQLTANRYIIEEKNFYLIGLRNLSTYYSHLFNYENAIIYRLECLNIEEDLNLIHKLDYFKDLNQLSIFEAELKNFDNAISYAKKASELQSNEEIEKKEFTITFSNLANFYAEIGNIGDAIEVEKRAVEYSMLYGEIEEMQYELTQLVNLYITDYNYNKALFYNDQLIKVIQEEWGEGNIPYLVSLYNHGNIHYFNKDLDNTIQSFKKCLHSYKSLSIDEKKQVSDIIFDISQIFYLHGYLEDSTQIIYNLINLYESWPDLDRSKYIKLISILAMELSEAGEFSNALKYGCQAKDLVESIGTDDMIIKADVLHRLARIFAKIGNFEESIKHCTSALDIKENLLGGNHISTIQSRHMLGIYYADRGKFDIGIKLLEECLSLKNDLKDSDKEEYSKIIGNLSWMYHVLGDIDKYEELITESINLVEDLYGNKSLSYAVQLHNLSEIYILKGDFYKALDTELQSFEIKCQFLNNSHPLLISSEMQLAFYTYLNGYESFLEDLCGEINVKFFDFIKETFIYLTPNERKEFWNINKKWFVLDISLFSFYYENNSLIQDAYNALLFSKGILLNSEIEFDQFIGETGNKELLEKYNEIKMLRLQLNKLYEKPIAERYCDTDSLERHVNELERKLMDESSEFGDYTKNLSVTWEGVQKGLGKKDAAIEFVHFPLNNDSTMYMAYVLRPEMESPSMVKLFEEKDLSKYIGDKRIYSNKKGSELIWAKLQPELEGVENVYFAPDGILHQIGIEYLPDFEDEEKMISDRYNLYRLSSTRQLALKIPKKESDKAVIYGGIQYDIDPETMESESRKFDNQDSRVFQPWYNLADTLSMRSGVKYLPFTLTEVNEIEGLLSRNKYVPSLMTGNAASEESFKNLSGKENGILHIATHGFYWQEEEADKMSLENDRLLFMSQFGDNARRNIEDKALTRTGLFMAGANNALSGKEIPEDIDDGILTASEIANLDLRGTDLVVLSACQTGMGDIGGDGVFGLQRGFKKAGVNSILMSLWDVDDAATGMFMTEFYRNFTEGKTKRESLKAAQDKVKNFMGEINGEYKNFSHPRYWAAFILLDALD